MSRIRILIVAGDEGVRAELRASVSSLGHPVCGAVGCAREALANAERCSPELAVLDCGLDEAAAERIRSRCDIPVVVVADAADEASGELLRRTAASGPVAVLLRPFAALQLDLTIRAAAAGHARGRLQRRELEQHVERREQLVAVGEDRTPLFHDAGARHLRRLESQTQLMETIFRSISDGIVVANAKGEFLYVNPAAEQIVGMGVTDAPQEEWAEQYGTYYPDRETPMPTEELPLLRAIHRGEAVDEEDVFIRNASRPDGVYIRVSARPLLNDIGGIRGGVIVFRDVTERVFAEEALTQAFAEGRLEIVDTILHNIGNAITSVTTGIETLRRNLANDRIGDRLTELAHALSAHREDWIEYLSDDPQGRQVLPFILALAAGYANYTQELAGTVDRVRDRAQRIADIVRTQKAPDSAVVDRKDIDLHEALASGLRVLRDSLVKRGVRTSIDCRRAPREIRVRESQFHQVLINLIKNAIEAIDDLATERGLARTPSIRMRAYSGDKYLNIEVADSGIGLRTRDTRRLFAPGYTTKADGSGLGLHSAANFVIAAGGRIEASSDGFGRGTTMRIMLPLSSVLPRAPDAPAGSQ